MKTSLGIASFALALALSAVEVRAQVVLSEINFTKNAQWIELRNMESTDVEISAWSIYHADSNKPGEHWFGFPKSTFIKANGYMRVHWLKPVQANTATDIYTGDTLFHFLFGLFAKELDGSRGAIAIFNTQSNAKMNTATALVDWVSWGTTGFKREDIAIAGKLWTANSFAPAASGSPLPSLAYDYRLPNSPGSGDQWFLDGSPTPGGNNIGNASVNSFGATCTTGLKPIANLVTNGMPAKGNKSFAVEIDRDLFSTEIGIQVLATKPDPKSTFTFFGCGLHLDVFTIFAALPVVPVNQRASVNFGQFNLLGVNFYTQWAVLDAKQGLLTLTNGLQIQFEN